MTLEQSRKERLEAHINYLESLSHAFSPFGICGRSEHYKQLAADIRALLAEPVIDLQYPVQIDTLTAQLATLSQDAARYRWLRERESLDNITVESSEPLDGKYHLHGPYLDEAIDAYFPAQLQEQQK